MTCIRGLRLVFAIFIVLGAYVPRIGWAQSQSEGVVRVTASRIVALINDNLTNYRTDPKSFYSVVETTLAPHFDFELMSKLALGNDVWQGADPALKKEFVSQFRDLLVRTYGAVLLKYRGESISYMKAEALDKTGRVERVRTRVSHRDGRQDNFVDYVLVQRGSRWSVIDVSIDGVSVVTSYSGTFRDTVRRRGMKQLVADLHKLNQAAH